MAFKVSIDKQELLDEVERMEEEIIRIKEILSAIDTLEKYQEDTNRKD